MRKLARLGADRELIVTALGIPRELLRVPAIVEELQGEVERGAALHQIDLLRDSKRLRNGGKGSVNAVLASLRQFLKWGRPDLDPARDARPDQEAAVAELDRMLRRFRPAAR